MSKISYANKIRYVCAGCDEIIEPGKYHSFCPECGKVFCRECTDAGELETHDCVPRNDED